jgi:hypothetical protein
VGELAVTVDPEFERTASRTRRRCPPFTRIMEPQTFEQPPQTALQQSRPQSNDVNAMSTTSAAERLQSPFLLITFCFGFVGISFSIP